MDNDFSKEEQTQPREELSTKNIKITILFDFPTHKPYKAVIKEPAPYQLLLKLVIDLAYQEEKAFVKKEIQTLSQKESYHYSIAFSTPQSKPVPLKKVKLETVHLYIRDSQLSLILPNFDQPSKYLA